MYKIINSIPFEKKSYYLDQLDDVSILIKTLERKEHLKVLLDSIKINHIKNKIIIADDSKINYRSEILSTFPDLDITYVVLDYDAGTSKGRNELLTLTKTKYFILCDDDFIFTRRTSISLMKKMLENNKLDLLAGVFFQYNLKSRIARVKEYMTGLFFKIGILIPPSTFFEYYGVFTIEEDTIEFNLKKYESPFTICDITHNFFIAKTESIQRIGGWNPSLKGGEHQNFFIRAKIAGLKIATTRQFGIVHNRWLKNTAEYQTLRNRGNDYQVNALDEFGITKVKGFRETFGEKFGL